ncbi:lytic transglycosylase domain-containing protein [Microvirga tunisiensis]|uniref:Lytic transglycosylase domain-containing protein n=1 Tax=Microvirga tunisiensis TaxID=2108360 RepID=A0A5N7MCN9_9HYPH|nr:lytic transglycosylase domain-containing protein [Microvirga tunisiensis]MPR05664.1 lytic transglycosylase domain-containing protein [Microvirga tunisiensis]MPR23864.1 lytic transglycosylase domain-containing protein [Microvirga tunisiensis]
MKSFSILSAAIFGIFLATSGAALAVDSDPQDVSDQPAQQPVQKSCLEWAEIAERYYRMPKGMMVALIQNESRGNANALNIDGKAVLATSAEMAALIVVARSKTATQIDVGCGQINLKWHASGFKTLGTLLDPRINVSYAAWHLSNLQKQTGSWVKAAARYHSYKPENQERYICRLWETMKKNKAQAVEMSEVCGSQQTSALQ